MENSLNRRSSLLKYVKSLRRSDENKKRELDDNFFLSCPKCQSIHMTQKLEEYDMVCTDCGYHHYLEPKLRFEMLFDGKYMLIHRKIKNINPLNFAGYQSKKLKSKKNEAVQIAKGKIAGHKAVVIIMDKDFMMGSMGSYVGEAIYYAFKFALKEGLPVISFSQSGGARMQEGIIALMQMAKTSEIIGKFSEQGNLYISCFTNPTTGGVSASFASLGDYLIAEPGALIGFSGPRIIKNTIKEDLPDNFQKSEFLLEEGLLDEIVSRKQMKDYISQLLTLHNKSGI